VRRRFVPETFRYGDVIFRRRYVTETFCRETFCIGDVLCGDVLYVRRLNKSSGAGAVSFLWSRT
jgi:hypothetical protein